LPSFEASRKQYLTGGKKLQMGAVRKRDKPIRKRESRAWQEGGIGFGNLEGWLSVQQPFDAWKDQGGLPPAEKATGAKRGEKGPDCSQAFPDSKKKLQEGTGRGQLFAVGNESRTC